MTGNRRKTPDEIRSELSRMEPPQCRDGKPGDPQLSALYQYLANSTHLTEKDAIVDLGSGEGVLATAIAEVFDAKDCPLYIAVDLPQPLSKLALPAVIHNNSRKVVFDEFLDQAIHELCDLIKLVVIRNVFHELDICLTAKLIAILNSALRVGTDIYIQDMSILPHVERGSAGWDSHCFRSFLKEVGLTPRVPKLTSHSGIDWFFTTLKTKSHQLSIADAARACANYRLQQKKLRRERLREINHNYENPDNAGEVINLSLEIAALDVQLGTFESTFGSGNIANSDLHVNEAVVPLRLSVEPHAFPASSDAAGMARFTGVVATIRNKDDIKIPELVETANSIVWFTGYSQKHTFLTEANVAAFCVAARKGVDLRFLLVDPDSESAKLRASATVHAGELLESIRSSIVAAKSSFRRNADLVTALRANRADVRLSQLAPSCSYFIIDNLCFCSIYTKRVSGSLAPSIIFCKTESGVSGFYELLQRDFLDSYDVALSILGDIE